MSSEDSFHVDWIGFGPDHSPIAPLDAATFLARIELLSDRARSLTVLRQAFVEQHANGERLPRHPEPTPRRSR